MVEAGIPAEDARYILPNATETKIMVTMNARELLHFFELRCCERAQWEIRAMAVEMLRLVKAVAPVIFRDCRSRLPDRSLPGRGHDLRQDSEVREFFQATDVTGTRFLPVMHRIREAWQRTPHKDPQPYADWQSS